MGEVLSIRLKDVIDYVVDNRGKTPPTVEDGYELLEVNAIVEGRRSPDYTKVRKFVSEEVYATWFRAGHLKKNDILVPTVGTIGNVSFVTEEKGSIAQNLIAIRTKDFFSSTYLYYFLSSSTGKDLMMSLDIGGVHPRRAG